MNQFFFIKKQKKFQIPFSTPVKLEPHRRRALYCHSGLPDDLGTKKYWGGNDFIFLHLFYVGLMLYLGIQYQSYHVGDIVASDEHITLHPGLGHTGSEPFDEVHGIQSINLMSSKRSFTHVIRIR